MKALTTEDGFEIEEGRGRAGNKVNASQGSLRRGKSGMIGLGQAVESMDCSKEQYR